MIQFDVHIFFKWVGKKTPTSKLQPLKKVKELSLIFPVPYMFGTKGQNRYLIYFKWVLGCPAGT